MADFAPFRTGQLVVRRQPSWLRRGVASAGAVLILVLLYGMFEWGRFQAGYSKVAEIRRGRELSSRLVSLKEENEALRSQLAAADLARDVERKAYSDVEKNLADLQAQVLKQKEELTFYRGIVSPDDGIGGLRIQRFQVLEGTADRRFQLRVVLVQSMRQEAVASGAVAITVEGVSGDRRIELPLAQLTDTPRQTNQVAFQFRYFQTIEQDVVLPEGFEPSAVNLEVRSSKLAPVRESFPWRVSVES